VKLKNAQNTLVFLYRQAWQIISIKPILLFVALIQVLYMILTQFTWKDSGLSVFLVATYWAVQEAGLISTTVLLTKGVKITFYDIWISVKSHFLELLLIYMVSFLLIFLPLIPILVILLFFFPQTPETISWLILGSGFIYIVFAEFGISYISFRMVIIHDTKGLKGVRESIQLFIRHFFEYSAIILVYTIVSAIGIGINYFMPAVFSSLSAQNQTPVIGKILTIAIVLGINIPVSAWVSSVFTLTFLKHTSQKP
jgi:hypothetical protein